MSSHAQHALPEAPHVLVVSGIGLRAHGHEIFSGVEFAAPARSVVAVVGGSGSGKTCLLLALAGRMRLTEGAVQVGDVTLDSQQHQGRALRAVRRKVSIARIGDLIGLDPELTVHRNISDAADWLGIRHADAFARVQEWRERLDLTLDPHTRVSELTALEAAAAHLVLGVLDHPVVVMFDDVAAGLQTHERERMWAIAREIAATGPVVVASTLDTLALDADVVVRLDREHGAHRALDGGEPAGEAAGEPEGSGDEGSPGAPETSDARSHGRHTAGGVHAAVVPEEAGAVVPEATEATEEGNAPDEATAVVPEATEATEEGNAPDEATAVVPESPDDPVPDLPADPADPADPDPTTKQQEQR